MLEMAPLDAAVDQMGTGFMHDCLPPFLTGGEFQFTCVALICKE